MEQLNQILYNRKIVNAYCDSSNCLGQSIIGLSACYVGCGMTFVESKKIYTQYINKSLYAELLAVKFTLETLPMIIEEYKRYSHNPMKVNVFSDVHVIENFIYKGAGKKAYMRELVVEIFDLIETLSSELSVCVRYLGKQKKYNIYHNACHNGARMVIGKKI
ncbi:hypothetical protein [Paenibacillus sp. 2TAB19]|uniref:hypothetical protein n=1 Tax=Paenibacillus sp. 2TAB19 TaxID=3233003 RepID=UPI003F986FFE